MSWAVFHKVSEPVDGLKLSQQRIPTINDRKVEVTKPKSPTEKVLSQPQASTQLHISNFCTLTFKKKKEVCRIDRPCQNIFNPIFGKLLSGGKILLGHKKIVTRNINKQRRVIDFANSIK